MKQPLEYSDKHFTLAQLENAMPTLLQHYFLYHFLPRIADKSRFCRTYNFVNKCLGSPSDTLFATDGDFIIARSRSTGRSVTFRRRSRTKLYYGGITRRLNELYAAYCLPGVPLSREDVVVDCGANVGELGIFLEGMVGRYVAVEPSVTEFQALTRNVKSENCVNAALWHSDGSAEFFDGNDTGDSSIFEISNATSKSVAQTLTLPALMDRLHIDHIRLLKLEAEGAEPEILEGAMPVLDRIDFIAADCGFERGLKQQSTLREVANLLCANGFSMQEFNYPRMAFLFKNHRVTG